MERGRSACYVTDRCEGSATIPAPCNPDQETLETHRVKPFFTVLAFLLLWVAAAPAAGATQAVVESARIWTDPEKTRLVFELSDQATHQVFTLDQPDRIVLDIENARIAGPMPTLETFDANLVGVRAGVRGDQHVRIVVDLKRPVRAKSFLLGPNERYGHRLVVDLTPRDEKPMRRVALASFPDASVGRDPGDRVHRRAKLANPVIIAIDAGHGGEDPGAIGVAGTREKDVTLAVARELARLVDRRPGLQALMIRDGDYYVSLRQRIDMARAHRADLFISIHADAFTNNSARGASVYTLSHGKASSSAATWLANRENSSDVVGGIEMSAGGDDLLTTVLLDMTQNATIEHSHKAAALVLANLGRVGPVHRGEVQRARFAVLKAPDVPSILVETAFLSNPEDERRLADPAYQKEVAAAILAGIDAYFRQYPTPGLQVAESGKGRGGMREYVINPGDTLSEIAKRHEVSLSALRASNNLNDDVIHIGQVLTIPEDS